MSQTPNNTPWRCGHGRIVDSIGRTVADVRYASDQADAILASVNAHAALVDALKCWPLNMALEMIEDSGNAKMWQMAQLFMEVRAAALKLAEGL